MKLNIYYLSLKLIFAFVLVMMILPSKANAKDKSLKDNNTEVVEKVKQIDNTGDTILSTARKLGVHGTTLDQIAQIFNGLKTCIDSYTSKFENSWSSIEGLKGIVNDSIGDLNIPDPLKAGDEILKVFSKQETDSVGIDPGIKGKNASKDFRRFYTYGQSGSVLGKEGQKVQVEESKNTNLAVQGSSSDAQNAQADLITQDILKKMADQNLQAQIIRKSVQNEEQQQTRLAAAADMNLADISENLDRKSRQEQLSRESNRKEILGTASFNDGFWEEKR